MQPSIGVVDSSTFPILSGAGLGALFVLITRTRSGATTRVPAIGLVVAALIYVLFALRIGEPRWVAIEAAGLVLFGIVAWLGRASAGSLALAWALHVAWDVGLHVDLTQPVVGPCYPLLCVGFDLVVAGFLLGAAAPPRHGRS